MSKGRAAHVWAVAAEILAAVWNSAGKVLKKPITADEMNPTLDDKRRRKGGMKIDARDVRILMELWGGRKKKRKTRH